VRLNKKRATYKKLHDKACRRIKVRKGEDVHEVDCCLGKYIKWLRHKRGEDEKEGEG